MTFQHDIVILWYCDLVISWHCDFISRFELRHKYGSRLDFHNFDYFLVRVIQEWAPELQPRCMLKLIHFQSQVTNNELWGSRQDSYYDTFPLTNQLNSELYISRIDSQSFVSFPLRISQRMGSRAPGYIYQWWLLHCLFSNLKVFKTELSLVTLSCIYVYTYIYKYISIYMYMYIYNSVQINNNNIKSRK